MKKAIQHIISLCMLLLFSNSSLFTHTITKKALLAGSLETISRETTNQTTVSGIALATYHKKGILNSDNEEEDSETMAPKKSVEKQSYQLYFLKQQAVSIFISYIKKTQAFFKEPSYLPSRNSLYIIFEVFRI